MNRKTLPARLAARPFDSRRRLPIPYVSEHDDGSVNFAVVNGTRALECGLRRLCSACGQPHEPAIAFVGGPGGFHQRRYTDPPMHLECAHWSLRLCPYLALQRHRRRGGTEQTAAPGFTDMEKAEPVILAVTHGYRLDLIYEPGSQPPAIAFRPWPWNAATRLVYRDRVLTEIGPEPLPAT
ncbi:hypothetical protein AB0C02_32980 [Micromonospora sp. NPDC048999]|uniref:hypothetical protein n=1 Tax=Micromonospora sp. NPDC048999 TaxID=3155391 RepID=UPI00340E412B